MNVTLVNVDPEIPTELLRRHAEAVSGHREVDVWTVYSPQRVDHPNGQTQHYLKIYTSEAEADADIAANPGRRKSGPYFTPGWATNRNGRMVSLAVETEYDGQPTPSSALSAEDFDSLFWSEAAIDKFMIPYYTTIYGPQYGLKIREVFDQPDVYALAHLPGSEYATKVVMKTGIAPFLVLEPIVPD